MQKSGIYNFFYASLRHFSSKHIKNPGVQKRISVFKDGNPEIDKLALSEKELDVFYEADFHEAGQIYKAAKRESKALKTMIEFKRIERLYFGARRTPNLLTWSEKEQIRNLSNLDPATWTPEKLALSFPATVDIIKKIIRADWKLRSEDEIKKHDKKVAANWNAIGRGDVELPPALKEHIEKFMSRKESDRVNSTLPNVTTKSVVESTANESSFPSEFLDIIKSYKHRNDTTKDVSSPATTRRDVQDSRRPLPPSETYVLEETEPMNLKKKYYTLDALRDEMKSGEIAEKGLSEYDKHFLKGTKPESKDMKTLTEPRFPADLLPVSDRFGDLARRERRSKIQCEEDDIPQKIIIPPEKRKAASVFQVNDCYYDESGEFLYRVPGMSKR